MFLFFSLWNLPSNSKSVILMSWIFLIDFSTPMILSLFLQTLYPLLIFFSPSEVDLTDYKPSRLGAIEYSFIDSTLTLPFIEDSKVTCVSTKVTCIRTFLLNMILMLLFF